MEDVLIFPALSPMAGLDVIHTCSLESVGLEYGAILQNTFANDVAWPAANKAIYVPFTLERARTVRKMAWHNGAAIAGNVDVGVHALTGARMLSLGSTAQAGTSVIQVGDVTDTLLPPGNYFMSLAASSASAQFLGRSGGGHQNIVAALGVKVQTSAFALPSTATFADADHQFMPLIAILFDANI